MKTQPLTFTPIRRLILAACGYLLIALAPGFLGNSFLMFGAVILYLAFALILLHAAVPVITRINHAQASEQHPVQSGKEPLLKPHYRLAWDTPDH